MLKRVEKKDRYGNTIICTVDENGVEQGPFEIRYKGGDYGKWTYKDGKLDGPYETYYKNGQLWIKCTYKDGKKGGPYEEYYENGRLFEKCTYKDGKEDGPYEGYWANGQLREKYIFKDGKKLKGKEAEDYLREWEAEQVRLAEETKRQKEEEQKREKKLTGLKARLAEVSDMDKVRATIKPARTPERTEELAEIMRLRRAGELLRPTLQKAEMKRDEETLNAVIDMAKPFEKPWVEMRQRVADRRMARRVKKGRE